MSIIEHERPRKPDLILVEEKCEWIRADGGCRCHVCGCEYREHDTVRGYRWLTRLCDGRLVKL